MVKKVGRKKGCIPWNKGLKGEEYLSHYKNRLKHTKEHNKKISKALVGGHRSKETRVKMSLAKKNYIPWNKGKKGVQIPWNKNKFGYSTSWKGGKHSTQTKRKIREKFILHIQKIYKVKKDMRPNIGKHEKVILDNLEKCLGYDIFRQYKVNGYFLDGFCPALNLAIEVDEKHHNKQRDKDQLRENNIKNELNCNFLRLEIGDICGI